MQFRSSFKYEDYNFALSKKHLHFEDHLTQILVTQLKNKERLNLYFQNLLFFDFKD